MYFWNTVQKMSRPDIGALSNKTYMCDSIIVFKEQKPCVNVGQK